MRKRALFSLAAVLLGAVGSAWATPLTDAARAGDVDGVRRLLAGGAKPDEADDERWCAIHYAAAEASHEMLSALIAAKANVNAAGPSGVTALHWAVLTGDEGAVALLLGARAECKPVDGDEFGEFWLREGRHQRICLTLGITVPGGRMMYPVRRRDRPQHWAAKLNEPAILESLLDAGAKADERAVDERTPLMEALLRGWDDIVPVCLAHKADPNRAWAIDNRQHPLHLAAECGSPDSVAALLAAGAKVNTRDGAIWQPLHYAARSGDLYVVSQLLAAKADVDTGGGLDWHFPFGCTSLDGETMAYWGSLAVSRDGGRHRPLEVACDWGWTAIAEQLLDAGAKSDLTDRDGRTAAYAAAAGGHLDTLQLLADRGADLTLRSDGGLSPLEAAALRGHADVAEWAAGKGLEPTVLSLAATGDAEALKARLAAGDDVKRRAPEKWTALHYAARWGHVEAARLLIGAKIDLEAQAEYEGTALFLAIAHGHTEVAKLLLESGAKADARIDYRKRCVLHTAAEEGNVEVAGLLIDRGADVDATDREGWTALDVAIAAGQASMVECLLKRGADASAVTRRGETPLELAADLLTTLGVTQGDIGHLVRFGRQAHGGQIVTDLLAAGAKHTLRSAAALGDVEAVTSLLAGGAKVDAADHTGRTALHLAALHGQAEVARVLLAAGADVRARTDDWVDDHYQTGFAEWQPLHFAADAGQPDVTRVLLAAGAPGYGPQAWCRDRKTPLDLAWQAGHDLSDSDDPYWRLDPRPGSEGAPAPPRVRRGLGPAPVWPGDHEQHKATYELLAAWRPATGGGA